MKGQNVSNDPLFSFRATGRTHRMLEQAMEHCREGNRAAVVFYDSKQFDHAHDMIYSMLTPKDRETFSRGRDFVKFGAGVIDLVSARSGLFDWRTERIQGVPIEMTFIDHSAYEFQFPKIIQGWAKYAHPPMDPRIEPHRER